MKLPRPLIVIALVLTFGPIAYAIDTTTGVANKNLIDVPQTNLQAQIDAAKALVASAEARLTAIGQCHAQFQLYVTRNGVAQCWNPVATFPVACATNYHRNTAGQCIYCPADGETFIWTGNFCQSIADTSGNRH